MTAESGDRDRRLIPRWRTWRATQALGETRSLSEASSFDSAVDWLDSVADSWLIHGGIARGIELVSAALTVQRVSPVADMAAKAIIESAQSTELQRKVSQYYLSRASEKHPIEIPNLVNGATLNAINDRSRAHLATLKDLLERSPHNALNWMDLSREYIILGSDHKALRAARTALSLEPHNRFLQRSAVALYVHLGEDERALQLLQHPGVDTDPWLLAARVSLDMRLKKSKSVRNARRSLDLFAARPWHLGELAAGLATHEFESGNDRRGRQLMRRALIEPTENVLAQAEAASDQLDLRNDFEGQFFPPAPFEALARRSARECDWSEALRHGLSWVLDQPFSVDASAHVSLYAIEAGQFALADDIVSPALLASPHSAGLLNNRAFARASAWRLADAARDIAEAAKISDMEVQHRGCIVATTGFVQFRSGDATAGRDSYERAIKIFQRCGRTDFAARAAINLAAEELRTESPESPAAVARAQKLVQESGRPEVRSAWLRHCVDFHPSSAVQVRSKGQAPIVLP